MSSSVRCRFSEGGLSLRSVSTAPAEPPPVGGTGGAGAGTVDGIVPVTAVGVGVAGGLGGPA